MIARIALENLYRRYNRRRYVHPDPLQFLYRYPEMRDREIVGLVASSLAYGRVAQILASVETVLAGMGKSPYAFVRNASRRALNGTFSGFKHRFTTGRDLAALLIGIGNTLDRHESLNRCFVVCLDSSSAAIPDQWETVLPALPKFAEALGCAGNSLMPSPARGSACKRLNLFLRWMARCDAVDPGGWKGVHRSRLIVPLDTHMARIGRALGFTRRKASDMKTALEITDAFRKLTPQDPVKYDFALTRFGIRDDLDADMLPALSAGDKNGLMPRLPQEEEWRATHKTLRGTHRKPVEARF